MRELLSVEEMAQAVPLFRGKVGNALVRGIKKIFSLKRLEKLVNDHADTQGWDFSEVVLEELGIDYEVGGVPLEELPKGSFITIHNHPYGGIDGCALVNLFGRIDPSYKLMVNKMLARLWPLEDSFITVIPTGEKREAARTESINGVKESLLHIRGGGSMGIFPSGAVSDFNPKEHCVRDREWQEAAIKLIKKLGVPIVPVRFFDGNSKFYYRLGLINWKVRLLKLPSEIFNKHGKRMRIGIGPVITPEAQKEFKDIAEFGRFLRSSVYDMPEPQNYIKKTQLPRTIQ